MKQHDWIGFLAAALVVLAFIAGVLLVSQNSGAVEHTFPEAVSPKPHFVMGGETYWYWSGRESAAEIPDGYVLAGEIQKEAALDAAQNFEASGLSSGTKIYVDADAVWEAVADCADDSPYLASCVPYRASEASQIYLRYDNQLFVGLSGLSDSLKDSAYYRSFDRSLYEPQALPPDARPLGEALRVEREEFPEAELETNYSGGAAHLMAYAQDNQILYLQGGAALIAFVPYRFA